jgi:hypothetical protein
MLQREPRTQNQLPQHRLVRKAAEEIWVSKCADKVPSMVEVDEGEVDTIGTAIFFFASVGIQDGGNAGVETVLYAELLEIRQRGGGTLDMGQPEAVLVVDL